MIEAISTGRNTCYGKKGELKRFAENNLIHAIKNGYIKVDTIKLVSGTNENTIKEKEVISILPEKKVYIHDELDMIDRALMRIFGELKFVTERQNKLMRLIRNSKQESKK